MLHLLPAIVLFKCLLSESGYGLVQYQFQYFVNANSAWIPYWVHKELRLFQRYSEVLWCWCRNVNGDPIKLHPPSLVVTWDWRRQDAWNHTFRQSSGNTTMRTFCNCVRLAFWIVQRHQATILKLSLQIYLVSGQSCWQEWLPPTVR